MIASAVIYLLLAASAATSVMTEARVGRPAAKALTACNAITSEDVEGALRRALSRGVETNNGRSSTCDYTGTHGQVTITIQRFERDIEIAAEVESLREAIPGATVRSVSVLGDRAFFFDIPGAGTQLHIVYGTRGHILISVLGFGEASEVHAAAEKLGRTVLLRTR